MSLEIEKDFELDDKTIDNTSELDDFGVWVKSAPRDFESSFNTTEEHIVLDTNDSMDDIDFDSITDFLDKDKLEDIDLDEITINDSQSSSENSNISFEDNNTNIENSPKIEEALPTFTELDDTDLSIISQNIPEIDLSSLEDGEIDLSSLEDGEIDLDAFMDNPTNEEVDISDFMDSSTFEDGEIDLSAFMGEDSSIDIDSFMGQSSKKEQKDDILNEEPIDMELTFDDDFTTNTTADPSENIENFDSFNVDNFENNDIDLDSIVSSEFDDFDSMFDNIVDESSTEQTTTETSSFSSDIEFDDVSEFDDLLSSLDSETPSSQEVISEEPKIKEVIDYDLQVFIEDDNDTTEDESTSTDLTNESVINDVALFTSDELFNLENPNETKYNEIGVMAFNNLDEIDELEALIDDAEDISNETQKVQTSTIIDKNDIIEDSLSINLTEESLSDSVDITEDFNENIEENPIEEVNVPMDFTENIAENPIEEVNIPMDFTETSEVDILSTNKDDLEDDFEDDQELNCILENNIINNDQENSMDEMSKALLDKIYEEITSLKEEFSNLKNEVKKIKTNEEQQSFTSPNIETSEIIPENNTEDIQITSSNGFFADDEDDETIALSGDELNNILNSADFTEEFIDNNENVEDFNDDNFIQEEVIASENEKIIEENIDKSFEENDAIFEDFEEDIEEQSESQNDFDNVIEEDYQNKISEDIEDIVETGEIFEQDIEEAFTETIAEAQDDIEDVFTETIAEAQDDIEEVFDENVTGIIDSLDIEENPFEDFDNIIEESQDIAINDPPSLVDESIDEITEELANIDFSDDTTIPSSEQETFEDVSIEDIATEEKSESEFTEISDFDELSEEKITEENTSFLTEEEFISDDMIIDFNSDLEEPSLDDLDFSLNSDDEVTSEDVPESIIVESSNNQIDNEFMESVNDFDISDNDIQLFDDDIPTELPEEFDNTTEVMDSISDICDDQLLESNTDNFDITNTDSEVNNTENESNIEISEEDKTIIRDDSLETSIEEKTVNDVSQESDSNSINENLRQEIKQVLSFMDQLLEDLPEEKIAEVAKSDDFELYKKLFKELGLA